jgi:hypothetical protein
MTLPRVLVLLALLAVVAVLLVWHPEIQVIR